MIFWFFKSHTQICLNYKTKQCWLSDFMWYNQSVLSVSIICFIKHDAWHKIHVPASQNEYCFELRSWHKLIIPDFLFSQTSIMMWQNTKLLSIKIALKHVYYHARIESPVYVWCRIQHAWGWCTGMTQWVAVGREVGGGVHVWDRMYTRGGFMSMYGKTNTVL